MPRFSGAFFTLTGILSASCLSRISRDSSWTPRSWYCGISSMSCADAQKEIKLPKYEAWPNYNAFLPMNIERYFDFWNRGI
jgi:hypothetical protein